jgi:hypothetical protein
MPAWISPVRLNASSPARSRSILACAIAPQPARLRVATMVARPRRPTRAVRPAKRTVAPRAGCPPAVTTRNRNALRRPTRTARGLTATRRRFAAARLGRSLTRGVTVESVTSSGVVSTPPPPHWTTMSGEDRSVRKFPRPRAKPDRSP